MIIFSNECDINFILTNDVLVKFFEHLSLNRMSQSIVKSQKIHSYMWESSFSTLQKFNIWRKLFTKIPFVLRDLRFNRFWKLFCNCYSLFSLAWFDSTFAPELEPVRCRAGPIEMVRPAGLRRFLPVYRLKKIPLISLRFLSKNEFHNFLGVQFFLSKLHREQV